MNSRPTVYEDFALRNDPEELRRKVRLKSKALETLSAMARGDTASASRLTVELCEEILGEVAIGAQEQKATDAG